MAGDMLVAIALLLLGDFFSTFAYHVPGHVFGRFHSIVHHSTNRSFVCYALRHQRPGALVDGFLGVFFYLVFIPWLWPISPVGVGAGLMLAELHVLWRHQFSPEYRTPTWLQRLCQVLCVTTPERHLQHHRNARAAYGDIFTFFGPPARWWLEQLIRWKKGWRRAT